MKQNYRVYFLVGGQLKARVVRGVSSQVMAFTAILQTYPGALWVKSFRVNSVGAVI